MFDSFEMTLRSQHFVEKYLVPFSLKISFNSFLVVDVLNKADKPPAMRGHFLKGILTDEIGRNTSTDQFFDSLFDSFLVGFDDCRVTIIKKYVASADARSRYDGQSG